MVCMCVCVCVRVCTHTCLRPTQAKTAGTGQAVLGQFQLTCQCALISLLRDCTLFQAGIGRAFFLEKTLNHDPE